MQLRTNPITITDFDLRRLEGLISVLRGRVPSDTARLAELEEELDRAEVVEPERVPANVVTMNSQVLLTDLDTGESLSLTLVFPGTAEAKAWRISVLAPLGLALLGCREHEQLSWETPSRVRRLRVDRVLYQPEADGNYNL